MIGSENLPLALFFLSLLGLFAIYTCHIGVNIFLIGLGEGLRKWGLFNTHNHYYEKGELADEHE